MMIESKYRLEKINVENVEVSLNICNKYLGDGMYTKRRILDAVQEKNSYYYIVYDGDSEAGIFFCDAMHAQKAALTVTEEILKFCDKDEFIGMCHSIAITKPYRKSGLAQALLEHFCGLLKEQTKVNKVFALAWISKQYIPAANILKQCGFEECMRIKRPWYGKVGLKCHVCRKQRCECDGMLYRKILR